jgi:hypothetical protein
MYRFRLLLSILVLLALMLPFVLQQSFFPFMRFGMFAEAVTRDIQKERFELLLQQADGHILPAQEAGISASNLDYLLRNYYYRQESDLFLERYASLLPQHQGAEKLILVRILGKDSTVLATRPLP